MMLVRKHPRQLLSNLSPPSHSCVSCRLGINDHRYRILCESSHRDRSVAYSVVHLRPCIESYTIMHMDGLDVPVINNCSSDTSSKLLPHYSIAVSSFCASLVLSDRNSVVTLYCRLYRLKSLEPLTCLVPIRKLRCHCIDRNVSPVVKVFQTGKGWTRLDDGVEPSHHVRVSELPGLRTRDIEADLTDPIGLNHHHPVIELIAGDMSSQLVRSNHRSSTKALSSSTEETSGMTKCLVCSPRMKSAFSCPIALPS